MVTYLRISNYAVRADFAFFADDGATLEHGVRIVDQAMLKSHKKRSTFRWALGSIMLALCAATIPFASTYAAPQAASHDAEDNQEHAEGGQAFGGRTQGGPGEAPPSVIQCRLCRNQTRSPANRSSA